MTTVLKNLSILFLFIPSVFAQKVQIKEAEKEFKTGNYENVLSILSPIEYLIPNASNEDRVYFYYVKGLTSLELSYKKGNSSKEISQAITDFTDLIQIEKETRSNKYSLFAIKYLNTLKEELVKSANEDLVIDNFRESSSKFHQAYLIDKNDTLQLYNAALSYKNSFNADLALKCFEELKEINFAGNTPIYAAYSRSTLSDEFFASLSERDSKIKSGSHLKPRTVLNSKKPEIYKNIVQYYIQKGYNEKALKVIEKARDFNYMDQSLALVEANLYLETKDYDYFDKLAAAIIVSNPNNSELLVNLGLKCHNKRYDTAAEYYYKKAIEVDTKNVIAYVNLSALYVTKSVTITAKMNELGTLAVNKKKYEELKIEKEQINRILVPYLQKIVSIDPFNTSVSQLLTSVAASKNTSNRAVASNE